MKKFGLLVAAAALCVAGAMSSASVTPASAQGISVRIGDGGGPGYRRGFRGPRERVIVRRGYDRRYDRRGPRGRAVIIRR